MRTLRRHCRRKQTLVRVLLEKSQLEVNHQVEMFKIRKAKVEELMRQRHVVEEEDLKTIAFLRNSLIEIEKSWKEDEAEKEEGEDKN